MKRTGDGGFPGRGRGGGGGRKLLTANMEPLIYQRVDLRAMENRILRTIARSRTRHFFPRVGGTGNMCLAGVQNWLQISDCSPVSVFLNESVCWSYSVPVSPLYTSCLSSRKLIYLSHRSLDQRSCICALERPHMHVHLNSSSLSTFQPLPPAQFQNQYHTL